MQDPEYWHYKWTTNNIGFHLGDEHPALLQYWDDLQGKPHDKVLVPLCGKSEDLAWLAQYHNEVIGVELSPIAVRAFFAEHHYPVKMTPINEDHQLYQYGALSLYTGDIFTAPVGPVDLIYDRAALVALPEDTRLDYVDRLGSLLKSNGRILLVTLNHEQTELKGPPFSISAKEVQQLFAGYTIKLLDTKDPQTTNIQQMTSQTSPIDEHIWLIQKT